MDFSQTKEANSKTWRDEGDRKRAKETERGRGRETKEGKRESNSEKED